MTVAAAWIREDVSEIRLLTAGGEEVWRAPAPSTDAPLDAFALRDRAREAAAWTASRLGPDKRLGVVCVDVEDAACVFASAPSADPEVVAAAMRSGATDYDALTMRGHMQPLVRAASKPGALSSPTIERLLRRAKKPGAGSPTGGAVRTAVLATPDSLVRLWLDQLDRAGVSVGVVVSLWHALADVWGERPAETPGTPGAPGTPGPQGAEAVEARDIGAIDAVILEDAGRLVWSWARGGNLVAAGELSVRRSGFNDRGERWNSESWFPAAASRLALDWLTWSTHLGESPARVRVVGADARPLANVLDERWAQASVTATTQNDPVGAALRALAQREERALPENSDPRRSLVSLSRRRGRAHATLYTWSGVATGLCAVAVFALGWRAMEKRSAMEREAREVRGRTALLVQETEPAVAGNPDRVRALDSVLQQLRKERPEISDPAPARPVLDEVARLTGVLEMLAGEGAFFTELDINETLPSAAVRVPSFESAERMRETLLRTPGQIEWNMTFQRELGPTLQEWKLTGQWRSVEAQR